MHQLPQTNGPSHVDVVAFDSYMRTQIVPQRHSKSGGDEFKLNFHTCMLYTYGFGSCFC